MLFAALWYLKERLGITKVWYHSYETGRKIKVCNPPKSLYTSLPKRFAFRKTSEGPAFIMGDRYLKRTFFRKEKQTQWHYLELG